MGADEPLTNREITAKFADIDKKFDQERADHGKIDDRITALAGSTVSVEAWARENGHIQKDIAEVDAHCEERHRIQMAAIAELKKRAESNVTRWLMLGGIAATLVAAWWAALHSGGH